MRDDLGWKPESLVYRHLVDRRRSGDLNNLTVPTIAKAVRGFANRRVEDALRLCKGTANLIVGAEHDGTLRGVTPMDNAVKGAYMIQKRVAPGCDPLLVVFN